MLQQTLPERSLRLTWVLERPEPMRLAALLTAVTFLADQASKSWALATLQGASHPFAGLNFAVVWNDAFVFSSGSGVVPAWVVASVRLIALLLLMVASRRLGGASLRYACGFALVLGGGLGNAADVAFRGGAVVDFVGAGPFTLTWGDTLYHMEFVFNVADVFIVMGLVLLAPLIRAYALDLQGRLQRWERGLRRRLLTRGGA